MSVDEQHVHDAHQALLADQAALERLQDLRGWTRPAIETLGLGIDAGRVLITVRDHRGQIVGLTRYQPNPDKRDGQPKMLAAPGSARNLFPAPETLPADQTVWLVEGEADSILAHSLGLTATGVPGSSSWTTEWATRFADRDVIVCCDCDDPGRGLAARAADDLAEHAASVRVLDLNPARDDGFDLSDLTSDHDGETENARQLLETLAADLPAHLPAADRPPRPRLTVTDFQNAVHSYLQETEDAPAWPIPFSALNDDLDGGIRPGEMWVIAGWTSSGKSIFCDQIADTVHAAGGRPHLYLTEMTVVQRGLRMISRKTGIPMRTLRQRRTLNEDMRNAAMQAARELPYAASVVTDWTPAQVAADVRSSRTNVAIVDLLHGFDYQDERDLSKIVSTFAKAATSDAAGLNGSALILVCQLNDGQMRDARSPARPKPGMHSLKGASWIKQLVDVVIFVHRDDDADGVPTADGEIWIAKQRNGVAGGSVSVHLDPTTLSFVERSFGPSEPSDPSSSWSDFKNRSAA